MSDLADLYQQAVLDHNNKPRNFCRIEDASSSAEGYNPLCGDIINVDVVMDGDIIEQIGFHGDGCAISKASASMMTDLVMGMTKVEAIDLFEAFHSAVINGIDMYEAIDKFGKLAALTGVSEFPARVKCVSLAWHTLKAAIEGGKKSVTTE